MLFPVNTNKEEMSHWQNGMQSLVSTGGWSGPGTGHIRSLAGVERCSGAGLPDSGPGLLSTDFLWSFCFLSRFFPARKIFQHLVKFPFILEWWCVLCHTCGGQRTIFKSPFSLSTTCWQVPFPAELVTGPLLLLTIRGDCISFSSGRNKCFLA